jgi:serine/threonine protein kinase
MDSERWRQIESVYRSAQGRAPEEQRAFLDSACGHDADLRQQVEVLLQQDSAGPAQGEPAQTAATQAQTIQTQSTQTILGVGAQLGPYKIEASIGAGGMGEVYRAVDTRLKRTVAIKVAKQNFGERFEREARAIAALNHPNICTLYDVGPNYLVMSWSKANRSKDLCRWTKLCNMPRRYPTPWMPHTAKASPIGI